jgi:serine/threonine protein kinase
MGGADEVHLIGAQDSTLIGKTSSNNAIDGFRVIRPIHGTARSHVFLAADPAGRRVALKIPASETAQDEAYLRRFVLEEWIARRVSSPHILRAAATPERRTALYVVTEFVEGRTLRQWMTDNPRPSLDEIRNIVSQIAAGLRALHRREMIHQDLRPENVMIDPDGTVKIIDLGSATVAGVEESAPGALGAMPGTFQYTAPEYLSGDAISWRSDQFALGVIAYEMATGRLPYGAQVARIRSRADQKRLAYRSARDDDTGAPDWVDTALQRAVHPDPLRRYDALSEFVEDLKRPGAGWKAGRHVPLAERNPVRFWQGVSAILAVLCLILAAQLGG